MQYEKSIEIRQVKTRVAAKIGVAEQTAIKVEINIHIPTLLPMKPKNDISYGMIGESSILATIPKTNPKMAENKTEYMICFLPTFVPT